MNASFNIGDKVVVDESAINRGVWNGYVGRTGTITEFLNPWNTHFTISIDGSKLDPIAIEAGDVTFKESNNGND